MFFYINDTLWETIFHYTRRVCDHPALLSVGFATVLAFLAALIGLLMRKRKALPTVMLLAESAGLASVHGMLLHLPLLHSRIYTALSTASSIIMSSSTYLDAFEKKAGIAVESASDIVYYLWYLSPKEMEAFTILNPSMLYEKVYKAFMEERYFFGYVNTDVLDEISLFYFILGVAGFLIAIGFSYFLQFPRYFGMIQGILFLCAIALLKNGDVLFLTAFLFSAFFFCTLLQKKTKNLESFPS